MNGQDESITRYAAQTQRALANRAVRAELLVLRVATTAAGRRLEALGVSWLGWRPLAATTGERA